MTFSHSSNQQKSWWARDEDETETESQEERPPSRFAPGVYNYQPLSHVPRRIHVVGTGSIGKLIAHSLRSIPDPPPVTLIFHKTGLIETWRQENESINITTDGITEAKSGYDIEVSIPPEIEHGRIVKANSFRPTPEEDEISEVKTSAETNAEYEKDGSEKGTVWWRPRYESDEPIHNLIICLKTYQTVSSLLGLRHRLTVNSTICFLQNGMGVLDEVNERVFPDEATRPAYVFGIVSHGVHTDPTLNFSATHAGLGTIQLGIMPRYKLAESSSSDAPLPTEDNDNDDYLSDTPSLDPVHSRPPRPSTEPPETKEVIWSTTSRYVLRTLTRVPVLCAVGLSPHDLHVAQLEKLAINSIINPLTTLLDGRNGTLLFNFALTRTMRLLLAETSLVLRSLPELQGMPNLRLKFSPDRLETLVVSAANATAENVSSMLADMRAGRQTEVEYINGYIVRRGEELGIRCAMNYLVMQMVLGKATMAKQEITEYVPMVGSEEWNSRRSRMKL
ncbi:MAG: hypothetical protein Q9165_006239 [Trypethelium subeluteriae]